MMFNSKSVVSGKDKRPRRYKIKETILIDNKLNINTL